MTRGDDLFEAIAEASGISPDPARERWEREALASIRRAARSDPEAAAWLRERGIPIEDPEAGNDANI